MPSLRLHVASITHITAVKSIRLDNIAIVKNKPTVYYILYTGPGMLSSVTAWKTWNGEEIKSEEKDKNREKLTSKASILLSISSFLK